MPVITAVTQPMMLSLYASTAVVTVASKPCNVRTAATALVMPVTLLDTSEITAKILKSVHPCLQ